MASYLWISNFAFFESFIKCLLDEFVEFHNQNCDYYIKLKANIKNYILLNNEIVKENENSKRKLQKPYDGRKLQQYKKHKSTLTNFGFHFPSEMLAVYGMKRIMEDIKEIRAKDIPEIIGEAFLYDFNEDEKKQYISYKDKRNNIAHGENVKYCMYDTVGMFEYFNKLAFKIDQHVFHNFFIREMLEN